MAKRTQEDPAHGHGIQANSQAVRELEECVCLDDPLHYFLSPHFYPSPLKQGDSSTLRSQTLDPLRTLAHILLLAAWPIGQLLTQTGSSKPRLA